ncbi:hypothetical protein V8F06_006346 [Rhypophila decipiens]
MQFSSANLAVILTALSQVASATVFTGTLTLPTGDKRNVAWTNGALNPCEETTTIGSGSGNPCEQEFSAGNIGGFKLVGCGGNGLTLFKDGNFNSNCKFEPLEVGGCPGTAKLEQGFSCF